MMAKRNRFLMIAISPYSILLLGLIALGLAAPWLPIDDPNTINIANKFSPCSPQHWLGTDLLGRDITSRLIWGIRTTLLTAVVTMLATTVIGSFIGSWAAIAEGKVDSLLMRICDIWMSFPSEVLILALVGSLGPGLTNVVIACIIAKWPWYARMMRAILLHLKEMHYVQFAQIAGSSKFRLLSQHMLPNVAGEWAVLATVDAGSVVLMISSLSFLGLGVQPPNPEWGAMLSEAKNIMTMYPEQMLAPGLLILVVVATLNFLGDRIHQILNPRRG